LIRTFPSKPRFKNTGYVYLEPKKAIELRNAEVRSGDLVFTARGTVGQVGLIPSCEELGWDSAILSANQLRYRPSNPELDPEFIWYLFSSWFVLTQVYLSSDSVAQPNLNLGSLRDIRLLLPPVGEQQTIAAFLDYETTRIDQLIAQQQRLIELLKEKRQAVISHAVTKGLNPNAPMKDSGIEWLGQVPEHWQCVPFGLLVSRADLGGNYLGGQEENGIPFLKMGNLGRGCIVLDKLECLEDGSNFDNAHRLSMGDFLFNTRNSLDLVGKVAVWHDELEFALYNSNLLRVRFKKDFVSSPDFMGFVFNSSGALGWLALLAKGTTSVAAIYYKDLRSMVVPIPPVDEQNAISSFISKCLSRLDTLEKKAIQSINLMNERRTALISAAVTGKIDLRGWTPPAEEAAA
ncbi:restriction endonuclease subunit S, partial [Aeromonas caviae]|uniref:restriction endonuclease subunit S n=1 Tax=Aeromonas caviae TaxID=648 RepID=UPI0029DC6CD8